MEYRKCGASGLKLPLISLGLWHNFGGKTINLESKKVLFKAFDLGITHFDLANNYGPPYGSAEANFGKIMKRDLKKYRDELIISSKAGYDMWDGPYGEWGSKKHVIASCDQSLKRMNLDYVDIFYSHRFDPNTPLEETADALESIYRSGKAQYIGISSYSAKQTKKMYEILNSRNIKILIHQPSYSLINRWIEKDLTKTLINKGIGCIAFSPLAQGMLSDKYLKGIPKVSRANQKITSLDKKLITSRNITMIKDLNIIAKKRGQSLSQMSIAWILNNKAVTSALIGVRNLKQLKENVDTLKRLDFTNNELSLINKKAKDGNINLWLASSSH
jgi:L-glyceraldehyde 3-phosphate reductase